MNVDLAAMQQAAGLTLDLDAEHTALAALADDGLVRLDWPRVTVPEEARPLMRSVACMFDAYLATGKAKHSRAV
jgi:oxygen-independent coproporphyrinogen III oxidase